MTISERPRSAKNIQANMLDTKETPTYLIKQFKKAI